jgi:hypothetical protein
LSQQTHREVVEEESFSQALAKLRISFERLDEIITGVHWGLCVHPEICHKIPGTKFSVIKTIKFAKTPELRIFFTYTENQVHLHHVELIQDGTDQSSSSAAASK